MRASLCLLLLPASTHAHRYALCHFSCVGAKTNETWRTCRSEKCTPRLPEDLCADGNEPALLDASGLEATDEAGVRVSGPQECADVYDAPLPGSFAGVRPVHGTRPASCAVCGTRRRRRRPRRSRRR